ncbi:hypothetical protein CEXT_179341 [Caerostris extrusa]|uniref:Uncharacterized protein n=1 Tax=Caerostris extrusa TaxID=172846 RepID=A0AAV4N994_CAEEX|nr:hypothetical protein CEXT_179341 [Caerostris extrusa]
MMSRSSMKCYVGPLWSIRWQCPQVLDPFLSEKLRKGGSRGTCEGLELFIELEGKQCLFPPSSVGSGRHFYKPRAMQCFTC